VGPPRYRNAVAEHPYGRIRVGTTEREAAIQALGKHLETGHLEVDEYTQRVERASVARTAVELDALFVDLPQPHYRPLPRQPHGVAPPGPPGIPPAGIVPAYPAPYGYDQFGRPLSHKSKVAAGVLQIVLPFGVGRFYMGDVGIGIAQLLLTLLCGVGIIWCVIDGIVILVQGGTDDQGRRLRD
jgi:TM2 domain-containing membrane protein YozV